MQQTISWKILRFYWMFWGFRACSVAIVILNGYRTEMAIPLNGHLPPPKFENRTLFPNRNYARCVVEPAALLSPPRPTSDAKVYWQRGKDRAQWNDIKDLFMIQHLLKATRQGKKSEKGSLVWNFNTKFGVKLVPKQFHTRGQTAICIIWKASRSYIRNTKSFRQLWTMWIEEVKRAGVTRL